jgi:DNA-binding NarL/FixJ family response regulator
MIYRENRFLRQANTKLDNIQSDFTSYVYETFKKWNLSKAEQEVAMFTLKGFSIKEVSSSRNVNEKTINAQLSSIYKKSNINNKYEFVSYFIEDIMNK